MELTNEFRVGVPVEDAWAILTDLERIAPCMPGAQLQEVEGDVYRGIVKIKVGPITAQYKGTATFQEQDLAGHRVVLKAEGRDTRGQGNANAIVTATLTPDGAGTKVVVATDLTITGKVAQFGRGVLADVSGKLLGQFVDNLERNVLSGAAGAAAAHAPSTATPAADAGPTDAGAGGAADAPTGADPSADAPTGADPSAANGSAAGATVRRIAHPEPEPVDLVATAGSPVAKRAIPLVGGLLAVFVIWRLLARRRR